MSVAARKIINYCINIILGYNSDWKRDINIGSRNKQNFVKIPHGLLREKISYLCELYGIKYHEQEESHTSKASFFDNDKLPVYNADNPQSYIFSCKKITRGQYRTAVYTLNAYITG